MYQSLEGSIATAAPTGGGVPHPLDVVPGSAGIDVSQENRMDSCSKEKESALNRTTVGDITPFPYVSVQSTIKSVSPILESYSHNTFLQTSNGDEKMSFLGWDMGSISYHFHKEEAGGLDGDVRRVLLAAGLADEAHDNHRRHREEEELDGQELDAPSFLQDRVEHFVSRLAFRDRSLELHRSNYSDKRAELSAFLVQPCSDQYQFGVKMRESEKKRHEHSHHCVTLV